MEIKGERNGGSECGGGVGGRERARRERVTVI